LEQFFSTKMPATQFLGNVFLFSVAGLLPVLLLYVFSSPGFASSLVEGGPALSRFLRQVVTNGLPVVFIINYIGFFLFALSQNKNAVRRDPVIYVLLDILVRVFVFLALHLVIYLLSADWFGSFGGSKTKALRAVAPTLARSALFENISGVYLYATLISASPLYTSAFGRSVRLRGLINKFPHNIGAFVLALTWFFLTALCLTILARIIVVLQG
jgi:hypothetical protein